MTIGKSIRIYLADATVTGIRYAELVNWTGHAIACPRSRLGELNKWPETSKPGVYLLFEARLGDAKPFAYVGESENVSERLTSHDRQKDFWNEVVIFTSKDENLTKAHVKYLESTLVSLAKQADRYDLQNGNMPPESSLPRADKAAMAEFIDNIRMVLGTLGYPILEPLLRNSEISPSIASIKNDVLLAKNLDLIFKVNNLVAYGTVTDEGFVVKKGSQASKINTESAPARVIKLRKQLISDNRLVEKNDHLVFTEDVLISSSSYAAALVAGTSRSGPQSWITKEGQTLKSIEDSSVEE